MYVGHFAYPLKSSTKKGSGLLKLENFFTLSYIFSLLIKTISQFFFQNSKKVFLNTFTNNLHKDVTN